VTRPTASYRIVEDADQAATGQLRGDVLLSAPAEN